MTLALKIPHRSDDQNTTNGVLINLWIILKLHSNSPHKSGIIFLSRGAAERAVQVCVWKWCIVIHAQLWSDHVTNINQTTCSFPPSLSKTKMTYCFQRKGNRNLCAQEKSLLPFFKWNLRYRNFKGNTNASSLSLSLWSETVDTRKTIKLIIKVAFHI